MIKTYRRRHDRTDTNDDFWAELWARQVLSDEYVDGVKWDEYPRVFARHLRGNALVLEAGCGLGKYLVHLQRKGHRVVGVDLDQGALVRAHQYDNSLTLSAADVGCLPFPDAVFDAYVSLGVIEHFEAGFSTILDEARRILKPQGLIFVSVPYLHLLRRLGLPRPSDGLYRRAGSALLDANGPYCTFYQYVFTKEEMVQAIGDAGFVVLETAYSGRLRWFLNLGQVRRWRARLHPSSNGAGMAVRSSAVSAGSRCRVRVRGWLKSLALLGQTVVPGWLSGHTIVVVGRLE
ncbi:MAG: methyltransferase domain-containing protein [Anaerolineae bacterium]|nr:methyltransferase domain-containing protein [Anaerolineae bacterium]